MSLVERLTESDAYLFIEKKFMIPLGYRRAVSSYQTLLNEAIRTGAVSQTQLDFLSHNPEQDKLETRFHGLCAARNYGEIKKLRSQLSIAERLDLERRRVEFLGVIKNLIEL